MPLNCTICDKPTTSNRKKYCDDCGRDQARQRNKLYQRNYMTETQRRIHNRRYYKPRPKKRVTIDDIEKLPAERFTPIKNYDMQYYISNKGRVFKINYGIMTATTDMNTQHFTLTDRAKKQKYHSLRRLVAEHFKRSYKPGMKITHKNNNKLDCRSCNLHLC